VLDIVLRPAGVPGGYEELLPRSLAVEAGDLHLRIPGRDDVIRMKRASGRQVDLEDIAAIEDVARRGRP